MRDLAVDMSASSGVEEPAGGELKRGDSDPAPKPRRGRALRQHASSRGRRRAVGDGGDARPRRALQSRRQRDEGGNVSSEARAIKRFRAAIPSTSWMTVKLYR